MNECCILTSSVRLIKARSNPYQSHSRREQKAVDQSSFVTGFVTTASKGTYMFTNSSPGLILATAQSAWNKRVLRAVDQTIVPDFLFVRSTGFECAAT